MHNHRPSDYICPFCRVVAGIEDDLAYTRQADVVHRDDVITAFISSHWRPNNRGHVLIVPNVHVENLYDMPDDLLLAVHSYSKTVARALKEVYHCDGVSVRQHNEPAGDQDVWHYHLHVFPRYVDDHLYLSHNQLYLSDPSERAAFAGRLRQDLQ